MLRERDAKFWTMWGYNMQGWTTRHSNKERACWGSSASAATRYFEQAASGSKCSQDWGPTKFDAPAIFGFADTMKDYCKSHGGNGNNDLQGACSEAKFNILRVGGWNMCKNMEWMFCAIKGRLLQGGKEGSHGGAIVFSKAPKELDLAPFSKGTYFRCCGDYAESDIYYLEVCVLNEMCSNRNELFALNAGDTFHCHFDTAQYASMQEGLQKHELYSI